MSMYAQPDSPGWIFRTVYQTMRDDLSPATRERLCGRVAQAVTDQLRQMEPLIVRAMDETRDASDGTANDDDYAFAIVEAMTR